MLLEPDNRGPRLLEIFRVYTIAEEFWRKLNEERDRDQYLARLHGASDHFKSLAASTATVDSRLLRIIGVDPERELIQELDGELRGRAGFFFEHPFATMMPELAGFTNLIIVFGSADIFTAVYQIICKYMERHKDHEIAFEKAGTRITVKGHSIPNEHELLRQLFPKEAEQAGITEHHPKNNDTER